MPAVLGQGKKPSSFTFANISECLTVVNHDTINFVEDTTNNPDNWEYFYAYTLTAGNFTFIDSKGVSRALTAVAANVVIPIPMRRIMATGTTGTALALIPSRY